jgi:hypothetical protein
VRRIARKERVFRRKTLLSGGFPQDQENFMFRFLLLGLLVLLTSDARFHLQTASASAARITPSAVFNVELKCGENLSAKDSAASLPCLPKDVNLTDAVTAERSDTADMTVEKKLSALKARCRKGKLVDGKRREIRFFKFDCWGNPPADYQEIQKQQQTELAKLKKRYNVIVLKCDPRTAL